VMDNINYNVRWDIVPDGDSFLLLRDDIKIVSLRGSRKWAEEFKDRYQQQEHEARKALSTGDPLNVCRLGWHTTDLMCFRFGSKINEAGGTLVYLVAEQPFEFLASIVKCLGNTVPWKCSTCNQLIDAPNTVRL